MKFAGVIILFKMCPYCIKNVSVGVGKKGLKLDLCKECANRFVKSTTEGVKNGH